MNGTTLLFAVSVALLLPLAAAFLLMGFDPGSAEETARTMRARSFFG